MITRSNYLVLALLAILPLAGSAAQATPPVIEPAPSFDFTDTTCGFLLEVHFTANGETAKIFSDGRVTITGPLKATYSANEKSVSLNIAGPGMITPSGAFIGHGVGAGPTVLPDGDFTFAYLAGLVNFNFSSGAIELIHGNVVLDICDTLAP